MIHVNKSNESYAEEEVDVYPASDLNYGEQRKLIITIYFYDYDSGDILDCNVMKDLDCTVYSSCELTRLNFAIHTDAYATNSRCVEYFIKALEKRGISIERYEFFREIKPNA